MANTWCNPPRPQPLFFTQRYLPFAPHHFYFPLISPLKAVLRYQRTDRRMSSVTFNNLVLADGQQHRLLFHLKGMQPPGPGGVELHLDCRLVETVRDLPAAFQGLPQGYGTVDLKTMQARDQVTSKIGSISIQWPMTSC